MKVSSNVIFNIVGIEGSQLAGVGEEVGESLYRVLQHERVVMYGRVSCCGWRVISFIASCRQVERYIMHPFDGYLENTNPPELQIHLLRCVGT